MQRVTPLPRDITVGAWINKAGGSLAIPEAGLKVVVPAGAVHKRTYFTATAHAGNLVSYEFGPHGTTFRVPLQMHQDIRDMSFWSPGTPLITQVNAAYFPDATGIDQTTGIARVSEILPTEFEFDFLGSKIRWNVGHFSGYLLASGRAP